MRSIKILLTLFVVLFSAQTFAATRPLEAGSDYQELKAFGSKTPLIYEFFNYGCPHCFQTQPLVHEFKKAHPEIKVQYVAIDLHPQWAIYSKAYYLTELLKNTDTMHDKIFHRVQVERKPIVNDEELVKFFVDNGVDKAKVEKALKSFSLQAKMRHGKQLAREYKVTGTPTFIVNERFRLDNKQLGTYDMISEALAQLSKQVTP